ncbi:MAG: DEAD/DEAH box helicase [Vulcanimicrobiota bacterium]
MKTLKERLYPYQVEGVSALIHQPGLLLADDMGLGKTLQTVAALQELLLNGAVSSALLIMPASLIRQWRLELYRWAPELTVVCVDGSFQTRDWKWGLSSQVFLVSYETLRNDLGRIAKVYWDLVILDEAQRIKNRDSAISRSCKSLPRARAWALTGTPLENREDDLASVLEFARPLPPSTKALPLFPGPRLKSIQCQVQLRRRKSDVLTQLPPKTTVRVEIEMSAKQQRCYKEIELGLGEGLRKLGEKVSVINVLQVISKLKQICNFCPESGESAKLIDLKARLGQLSESSHRALVFSQWKSGEYGIGRLAKELADWRPITYSGDDSLAERQRKIEQFTTDPAHRAMLISLMAGGQGLNLQAASYVFHFDRWWNPAVENQATDRSHRLGQVNPVTVYCYVTLGSIEERIEAILDRKLALFADIVDRVSLDPARLISHQELYSLFGLAPPTAKGPAKPETRDLVADALTILKHNRWDMKARTGGSYTGDRMDELGNLERLALLPITKFISDSAIREFLDEFDGAARILVCTSGQKARAAEVSSSSAVCWDETALENMSLIFGGR